MPCKSILRLSLSELDRYSVAKVKNLAAYLLKCYLNSLGYRFKPNKSSEVPVFKAHISIACIVIILNFNNFSELLKFVFQEEVYKNQ